MQTERYFSIQRLHNHHFLIVGTGLLLMYLLVAYYVLNSSSVVQASPATDTVEILVGLQSTDVRAASTLSSLMTMLGSDNVLSVDELDTRGIGSVSCDDSSVSGLRLTISTSDSEESVAALAAHPDVLFAIPNEPVFAADHPLVSDLRQSNANDSSSGYSQSESATHSFDIDDPLFADQQWYMDLINGEAALGEVFSVLDAGASDATEPIVVAIIDSGIDANHPEFTGRLLDGYNFLDPTANPQDDYGHGTHVAGLIGASVNNGLGIVGMSPNVMLLPYKTLDQNGAGRIDNVVEAVCMAVDDGADIINLSLTSPSTPQNTEQHTGAFDYARDRGVMMIAAAGNSRQSRNMWPARLPDVMAIAAIAPDGELATYSSPGDSIDMAAPGGEFDQQLLSTWPENVNCGGIDPIVDSAGGVYCDSIGTSMAAALVSGVAAVLKELHPNATADEIREVLTMTAQPVSDGELDRVGNGLLDAEQAVTAAMQSQLHVMPVFDTRVVPLSSPPFTVDIEITNPSFENLIWQATASDLSWLDIAEVGETVRFGDVGYLSITITPTDLPAGIYTAPITIVGKRPDDSLVFQNVQIVFRVDSEPDPSGQLVVDNQSDLTFQFSDRTTPFSSTVDVKNVGQGQLTWSAELDTSSLATQAQPWINIATPVTGTLDYLESVQITAYVTPTNAALGNNQATVIINAQRDDGSVAEANIDVTLNTIPSTLIPLHLSPAP